MDQLKQILFASDARLGAHSGLTGRQSSTDSQRSVGFADGLFTESADSKLEADKTDASVDSSKKLESETDSTEAVSFAVFLQQQREPVVNEAELADPIESDTIESNVTEQVAMPADEAKSLITRSIESQAIPRTRSTDASIVTVSPATKPATTATEFIPISTPSGLDAKSEIAVSSETGIEFDLELNSNSFAQSTGSNPEITEPELDLVTQVEDVEPTVEAAVDQPPGFELKLTELIDNDAKLDVLPAIIQPAVQKQSPLSSIADVHSESTAAVSAAVTQSSVREIETNESSTKLLRTNRSKDVSLTESEPLPENVRQLLSQMVAKYQSAADGQLGNDASEFDALTDVVVSEPSNFESIVHNSGDVQAHSNWNDGLMPFSFESLNQDSTNFTSDLGAIKTLDRITPETASSVVKQVLDSMTLEAATTNRASNQQLSIEIHPAELGRLEIYIGSDDETLKASIIASESVTSELLTREKAHLINALKEQGIELPDVTISHQDPRDQDRQQFNSQRREMQRQSHQRRAGEQESKSTDRLPARSNRGSTIDMVA